MKVGQCYIGSIQHKHYRECSKWRRNQVITIKLNCNEWSATYYEGHKEITKHPTPANKSYYFAMLCCSSLSVSSPRDSKCLVMRKSGHYHHGLILALLHCILSILSNGPHLNSCFLLQKCKQINLVRKLKLN